MRIISGRLRGRRLAAPSGETTRPTSDRVREAVFSAIAARLGGELGGGAVLDAFAGSGALGLEALSRGCSRAVFSEVERHALAALRANIAELGVVNSAVVLPGDVFAAASRRAIPGGPFALLLLDPPYRLDVAKVAGLIGEVASNGLLADGALVVWEHANGIEPPWPAGFGLETRKRYASTEVDIAVYERGA
jgi:16S rRNA (guanine966-N2)-methyltransferase